MARRVIKAKKSLEAVLLDRRNQLIKGIQAWAFGRQQMDKLLQPFTDDMTAVSPGSEECYFQRLIYAVLSDGDVPNVFYDASTNRVRVDKKEVVVKVHSHGKNRSDQGSSRAVDANGGETLHVHFFCRAYRPDNWNINDYAPYRAWQVVTRWITMDDFCAGEHRGGSHTIESHTNHRDTTKWILGAPPTVSTASRHIFYNVFDLEDDEA